MAELEVWMNGRPVAVWAALRTGTPVLRYHEAWVRSDEGRALSLSLPFTAALEHRGDAVTNYFDNLLPDSAEIRRRLRRRFHVRSDAAFDLLAAIGRDCVGAVQLLPSGATPDGWNRIEAEPLKDADVERILQGVTSDAPLGPGMGDELRISIAGAQEKTALLQMAGRWYRPQGATPTTHILKLPLGLVGNMRADMSESVENEWLCGELMNELGIATAPTAIATFGATKALVVTRFDRRWQGVPAGGEQKPRFKPGAGTWIARLPQEDFCQALGVAPDRKTESDGGPSARDCLGVLAHSEKADADRSTFALAQLAFWLLAATDGHAKNYSIQHRRGGRYGLAPLYDVLSAWPIIGRGPNQVPYQRAKLAMAVRGRNAHDRLGEIEVRHWRRLAETCGPEVWERMTAMVAGIEGALHSVESRLPAGFPGKVWERVAAGCRRHAAKFQLCEA
ncbi:MAG: type II toxin-antitoxin system HipA family toxin [Burkholderiales bacterium]|nr:type II toxin-antitoxin system HipA family toxin [Burkholderiales bacterium]MDE1926127.1 type II toxin-antitoxin system HipA family toxin [Burkholderiales bacterium]MDE2158730.1 type II toxin-antitoxin system HipA family toxin [Burkholderiales bacterium]